MAVHAKKNMIEKSRLYCVTDLKDAREDILEKVDGAYRGGADIVQLRSKVLTDSELYRLGNKFRQIATHYGKYFVVNDRLDLALAVHADGLHIGQGDLPAAVVRRISKQLGIQLTLGKSTHNAGEARRTLDEEDVDYISVGPVFSTPTKPDYEAIGLGLISEVKSWQEIPFVAIGGINASNLPDVLGAGASCVGVVREVLGSENPCEAAMKLRKIMGEYRE